MAVKIRLRKIGAKKKLCNRIIVCDSRVARTGKFVEDIGMYDPSQTPQLVQINKERALYWLKTGAKPSETVKSIFKKQGIKVDIVAKQS